MTRILQISDTHIVPPGALAYGKVDTAAALTRMVSETAAQATLIGPIDLILVTGDLVDHGLDEEYAEFQRLTAPLAAPLVAVPGNHDDRETMRAAFQAQTWMPKTGPINVRHDFADVSVLGLDTSVAGAPHGTLEPETLAWLAEQLRALAPKPLLIGMHHPPFDTGIALMDVQGLTNAQALADLLAPYPGRCRVVAGHVHRMVTTTFAGHTAMICPGASHAVTLDLRLAVNSSYVCDMPGMLLHDFSATPNSHFVPTGAVAGPFPFAG